MDTSCLLHSASLLTLPVLLVTLPGYENGLFGGPSQPVPWEKPLTLGGYSGDVLGTQDHHELCSWDFTKAPALGGAALQDPASPVPLTWLKYICCIWCLERRGGGWSLPGLTTCTFKRWAGTGSQQAVGGGDGKSLSFLLRLSALRTALSSHRWQLPGGRKNQGDRGGATSS